jgi:dethiobiotin synthetase
MMPPLPPVIAITGIDTNIGKTVVTGLLARFLLEQGRRVITQKVAQTGCSGFSEDIATHRQLMGLSLLAEDQQGLTCPYTFPRPCSPHLAAALAGRQIDPHIIRQATHALTSRYEMALLEGAGGLLVPLTEDFLFLDYLEQEGLPLIVVSSPRLGSINHTLAALELARNRGLTVLGIAYNRYQENDPVIANDSARLFLRALHRYGHHPCVLDIFAAQDYLQRRRPLDFSPLFQFSSNS